MPQLPFVVPVMDLRNERAEPKAVEIDEAVEWRLDMARVAPHPALHALLDLERVPGGILVSGRVTATLRHTCHRCLDEWDESVIADVAQIYVTEGDDEADYVVTWPEIDLEPMMRDEVLLSLPLVPTCPDGCRGVVGDVESRLNIPTPDDTGDSASPFAVLKDLLDAGE